ncbi:MAG: hypothetical protein ACKOPK_26075, partial [Dolichospermum sp.]
GLAMQKIAQKISSNIANLIGEITVILDDEFAKLYRDEWRTRKSDVPILQALAEQAKLPKLNTKTMLALLKNIETNLNLLLFIR